jgi:hypothetical protein
MFFASSGSGYGHDSGFGGVYEEDAGGSVRGRRGLEAGPSTDDALKCAAFTGPFLAVVGLFFLVFATFDPQHKLVRSYNAAVSDWAGPEGGCAQFGAALPAGTPVTLKVQLPPPSASVWITLESSDAVAPRLGNATRRVVSPPASAALSFVGLLPLLPRGLPANATSMWLELAPDTADGAFSVTGVPLQVVSCTSTASTQYGINCSADSPPAPAPSAATELFVLERHHRRRGRALAQVGTGSDDAPAPGSGGGGFFSGGGSPPRPPVASACRAYYRTVTLLTGVTLVATPPAPPDGLGVASNNWTLGLAPCGMQHTIYNVPVSEATFRSDSRSTSPAWCSGWPAVADGVYGGPPDAGLTITLRAAGDPVLVGASLTRCRMALGVPPGDYARRGAVCLLLGSLLTAGGLWGLARAAALEGHALAVPSPMASLRSAVQAVASYGATAQGYGAVAPPPGEATGFPATFLAAVTDPAGARRRAAATVQPPPAAQPFDGPAGGAEAHKL